MRLILTLAQASYIILVFGDAHDRKQAILNFGSRHDRNYPDLGELLERPVSGAVSHATHRWRTSTQLLDGDSLHAAGFGLTALRIPAGVDLMTRGISQYQPSAIRLQLSRADLENTSQGVKKAHECYLEMSKESKLQIETMVSGICTRYWEMRPAGNFGAIAGFELLVMTWLKLPGILKQSRRKAKKVEMHPERKNGKPAKVKDRPQWFCWTCREWHKSDTELASCPLCGASLGYGGPAWAGWRWG